MSKSVITFGSRVHGTTQNRLKNILKIPNIGGGGKYLGLPEEFGRRKQEMFAYIVDRVKKRTATWSAKFLSPAGKEIMLKSVALAMPVYAMSCFKLPLGVVNEIETLLMNYWWEKGSQQRGIPWIAWKRLQYSKKEGGLGFRDLAKFNDALLAKQAWRMIQNPNSLVARLMKARYFKDETVLDAKARAYQSYGWASMLTGLALIKKGSRFQVGDGNSIRMGVDNLVSSHPPRPLQVNTTFESETLKMLISSKGSFRFWDSNLVDSVVNINDHSFINNIYLSRIPKPDKLIWNYNNNGMYTVKSGYWLLTHDPGDPHAAPPIPHGSIELKNRVWRLPLLPKIKHFLWRILSKALATNTRLNTRGMKLNSQCSRCRNGEETINHSLFTCPFAIMTWRLSGTPAFQSHQPLNDVEENITKMLDVYDSPHISRALKLSQFWVLWRIWKARNNFVFNQYRESPSKVVLKAKAETIEWIKNTAPRLNSPMSQFSNSEQPKWYTPEQPFVKCNFDASFNQITMQARGGWIIRDHHGTAKAWGSLDLNGAASPLMAEAKALLASMHQAWLRGFSHVILEGDCEVLINLINGNSGHTEVENLLQDIGFWRRKFSDIRFNFVKRSCNCVADSLAKFVCPTSFFLPDPWIPPMWFKELLCNDLSA